MLIAAVLTIGLRIQRLYSTWFRTVERGLGRIARRPWLPVTLVGMLAFGGSAALSLLGRIPEPTVHDEYSYSQRIRLPTAG
jgi:hypothetical protein